MESIVIFVRKIPSPPICRFSTDSVRPRDGSLMYGSVICILYSINYTESQTRMHYKPITPESRFFCFLFSVNVIK